jgi:hypothetical protein
VIKSSSSLWSGCLEQPQNAPPIFTTIDGAQMPRRTKKMMMDPNAMDAFPRVWRDIRRMEVVVMVTLRLVVLLLLLFVVLPACLATCLMSSHLPLRRGGVIDCACFVSL